MQVFLAEGREGAKKGTAYVAQNNGVVSRKHRCRKGETTALFYFTYTLRVTTVPSLSV